MIGKECLAVLWVISSLRGYLGGSSVYRVSDYFPLFVFDGLVIHTHFKYCQDILSRAVHQIDIDVVKDSPEIY